MNVKQFCRMNEVNYETNVEVMDMTTGEIYMYGTIGDFNRCSPEYITPHEQFNPYMLELKKWYFDVRRSAYQLLVDPMF